MPRIIAFYLPQFHPIPENDEWWGKGFTEWTNVKKAKKLFLGHSQPKIPTELGYYDLRDPWVYKKQIELAREAGVEGFCFWHYYFGNGKQLLEKPIKRIIEDKDCDFPFCLGWANESWEKKLWNKDCSGNVTLIEQTYGGKEDYKKHFETIYPIISDSRYITVDGAPLFFIYKPDKFSDCKEFLSYWRELLKERDGKDFHFVAQAEISNGDDFEKYYEAGFDAVYSNRILFSAHPKQNNFFFTLKSAVLRTVGVPIKASYKKVTKKAINKADRSEKVYPGIICGWDHTPRSGKKGIVLTEFTLPIFKTHINDVFEEVSEKSAQHQIVFLKSWNEWGEGNFMEPDLEYGRGKIEILGECFRNSK